MNRSSFLKFISDSRSKTKNTSNDVINILKSKGVDGKIINDINNKILKTEMRLSNDQIINIAHYELDRYIGKMISDIELHDNKTNFIILCGINGSGKTTTSFKILNFLDSANKSTHLVNCDTIREGAVFQFDGINESFNHKFSTAYNKDFENMNIFIEKQINFVLENNYNVGIFDTPGFVIGNLETLEYVSAVTRKIRSYKSDKIAISVIFIADVNIGQNILMQTAFLSNNIKVDSIIISKYDINPSKIGYIFQAASEMNAKVSGIAYGTDFSNIRSINKSDVINAIISEQDFQHI